LKERAQDLLRLSLFLFLGLRETPLGPAALSAAPQRSAGDDAVGGFRSVCVGFEMPVRLRFEKEGASNSWDVTGVLGSADC
jgi:hypothetical protein